MRMEEGEWHNADLAALTRLMDLSCQIAAHAMALMAPKRPCETAGL